MRRRYSIRWQLPLSYVAVMLITVLVLGGGLLLTLQNTYRQQERDFLTLNANAMRPYIADALQAENGQPYLQMVVSNYALVSSLRMRVLDTDQTLLVDSGTTETLELVAYDFVTSPLTIAESDFVIEPIVSTADIATSGDSDSTPFEQPAPVFSVMVASPIEQRIDGVFFCDDAESNGQNCIINGQTEIQLNPTNRIQIYSNPYGGVSFAEFIGGAERVSDERVQVPIYDIEGILLGYLELSNGPALGHTIIANVQRALIGAGLFAGLLAALVGWGISRRMSQPLLTLAEATRAMAGGDLQSRVNIRRRDELGLLANTFNHMADRIQATIDTLKRFVTDAAHELHTPITVMRTNLELALENDCDNQRQIEVTLLHLKRMQTLTDDLLDLARLEAQTAPTDYQTLNLNEVVRQHTIYQASQAEQRDINFTLDLTDMPLLVWGNAMQLGRVVHNLVDNAVKFTPAGGNIYVKTSLDADCVRLSVADTGIGILYEDAQDVFSRFRRGRNASKYPGSGIGLMIAKTIVEKHDGCIWFEHQQPMGTKFLIDLPLYKPKRNDG